MRSNYSLNHLYYSVKLLLEKYDFVKQDCKVSVSFDIEETKSGVVTRCMIIYKHDLNRDYELFASGVSPDRALSDLEKGIQEKTNKALVANIITCEFETEEK